MKRFYTLVAAALLCMTAVAQDNITLSTYSGTDVSRYVDKTVNVTVFRYVFNGWNTLSLPFDMSEEQLNEFFGSDCILEKLAGVENDGNGIKLNFQNCKEEGLKANVPYILKFNGESTTKKIKVSDVVIDGGEPSVTYTVANTGESVTFAAANEKTDSKGLYGILAKDNQDASFVNVDDITTGFYATRCYVKVSSGNSTYLTSNHINSGDASSINDVVRANERVNVYNVSGALVSSSASLEDVANLTKGIYVIKGKTVLVK